MRALLLWMTLAASLAGCRRGPSTTVDPMSPDSYGVCPEGAPHLVVALAVNTSEVEQALLRFTEDLAPCRGAVLPDDPFGTIETVGGLADGTDVVGFSDYYGGGRLVRLAEGTELARIEDEQWAPIGFGALTFRGQSAVATVWGSRSSSDSGERLDVYAQDGLAPLGGWEVSYELVRAAAPPTGQADRIATMVGDGLREQRADPGATTLATTGEITVTRPNNSGYVRSLDVSGSRVRVAVSRGVLSWTAGAAPAFLGPVRCEWPATTDTPLPGEDADYVAAVIDPSDPEQTLVIVNGELSGGSETRSHLYRMQRRGECELVAVIPPDWRGIAMAWAGR